MTDPATPNPAGSWPPPPSEPTPPAPPSAVPPQPPTAPPYAPPATLFPASAAPYPTSVAPYPTSVAPYGLAIAPPVAKKSNVWTIVLAVVSGVLLLGGGGVGALYYRDHSAAEKTSNEQQAKIADLQGQLDRTKTDLATAQRDLTDTQADAKKCTDAVQALFDFVPKSSTAGTISQEDATAIAQLERTMVSACKVS